MAIHLDERRAGAAPAGSTEIGRRWMALLEAGDVEGALALYAPDARVHTSVVTFVGYQGVRLYLGQLPIIGWRPPHLEFHAATHTLVILWRPAVPGCRDWQAALTRMRIQDGRIAEQWMTSSAARTPRR